RVAPAVLSRVLADGVGYRGRFHLRFLGCARSDWVFMYRRGVLRLGPGTYVFAAEDAGREQFRDARGHEVLADVSGPFHHHVGSQDDEGTRRRFLARLSD